MGIACPGITHCRKCRNTIWDKNNCTCKKENKVDKTAKEMFEELGYDCCIKHESYMFYEKNVYNECYEKCADGCYCDEDGYEVDPDTTYSIEFNYENKTFSKTGDNSDIEIDELKAINKQIEELGW